MGKINLKGVYHIGIPVNDLERAERFYVKVSRNQSGASSLFSYCSKFPLLLWSPKQVRRTRRLHETEEVNHGV